MDCKLSETQSLIARTVDALVADTEGDDARWTAMAELGLLGADLDEAHGGGGGAFEDLAVILQRLGRSGGSGVLIPVVAMAGGLVSRLGDEAQKAAWLAPMIAGFARVVLARDTGSPSGAEGGVIATASDGGWTLNGRVERIPGGAGADAFFVEARAGDDTLLFIVPATAVGVSVRSFGLYDGTSAVRLELDAVRVTSAERLGGSGDVEPAVEWAIDRANAAFVNEAIGLMERLCELTLDYIKTREQFGRTLGSFQVVQHRMVDMRIHLEMAKSMAILAAVAADDPNARRRARDISGAKAAIGKAGRFVAQSAIQLHGAIALTEEYPVGRYVRRLTLIERAFGDPAWHLERFAALSREAA